MTLRSRDGDTHMSAHLQAGFHITTPMFIGDADQKATGIRPTSIKGALRFWWRALNWPRFAEAASDTVAALRALHAEEARLFGASATEDEGEQRGGQGVFLMQVQDDTSTKSEKPFEKVDGGLLYLLGMGLATFKDGGRTLRNALVSGKDGGGFTLRLLFKPKTPEADKASVANAVWAFGLLGALGSRARHGLGSVSLTSWSFDLREMPKTRQQYVKALTTLLGTPANALPPFTALSQGMRLDLSMSASSAEQVLRKVGEEQMRYRSFGQNNKVLGQEAERNFGPKNPMHNDHDLVLQATEGGEPKKVPGRAVFGLPHNYFFSSTRGKADINYQFDRKDARRASPLLLHVHQCEGEFWAVHCLLPAQFLPEGSKVTIKAKRTFQVSFEPDWRIPVDYLNRFTGRETVYGR